MKKLMAMAAFAVVVITATTLRVSAADDIRSQIESANRKFEELYAAGDAAGQRETDAVDDIREFESSWAATDKITWLKPGSLTGANGQKILPKTPPLVQPALFQLMEFARDMVQRTTGVNEEVLGLVGDTHVAHHRAVLLREPGHVEHRDALALDMRRHTQELADRDDAGAADAGHENAVRSGGARDLRQRDLARR